MEGAGGLVVPIAERLDYAGLARRWGLGVLVVARPNLGALNHTFLTVHYARAKGLRVLGVVISGYPDAPGVAERTNPRMIEEMCGVPVLGRVPRRPRIASAAEAAAGVLEGFLARCHNEG